MFVAVDAADVTTNNELVADGTPQAIAVEVPLQIIAVGVPNITVGNTTVEPITEPTIDPVPHWKRLLSKAPA